MKNQLRRFKGRRSSGAIALTVAILLFVLLGLIALAVDVGYIMVTKTHLQAAVDAATLSAGTELPSGLGFDPLLAATVKSAGEAVAVDYASRNRNGDQESSYLDATRDVHFGWTRFDSTAVPPAWEEHWGEELPVVGGYNMVRGIIRRDQDGSSNDDVPLPLIFASALNHDIARLAVDATAVIMPANGIRITPGSPTTANAMPFAIRRVLWEKYLRAQTHHEDYGFPNPLDSVIDVLTGEPLFGHMEPGSGDGPNPPDEFVQDFFDNYDCGCVADDADSTVSAGPDGVLELDIFPRDDYTAGNMGTIDIGSASNGTPDIERQILYGANEDDMSYYPDNELTLPHDTGGDTGLSAGIKDELDEVQGQCRAVFLFDSLLNPGNTAIFGLVGMAGVRVMDSQLTGSMEIKHFSLQRCDATLTGSVGALEETIGSGTTVFTPLILIE